MYGRFLFVMGVRGCLCRNNHCSLTRDLKGLRVDSPCDNLFQTAIDIQDTLSHYYNGAPHPSLSKNPFSDGQFFLLGTLTRKHIATVNLLNTYCSEIPFISRLIRQVKCLPAKTRNCFDKSFVK